MRVISSWAEAVVTSLGGPKEAVVRPMESWEPADEAGSVAL